MEITLPVSGKRVELAVYSRTTGKKLLEAEYAVHGASPEDGARTLREFLELRDDVCVNAYASRLPVGELPNRDAVLLERVTYQYNMGVPRAEIKNFVAGEGGQLIADGGNIVTPAALSPGSAAVN